MAKSVRVSFIWYPFCIPIFRHTHILQIHLPKLCSFSNICLFKRARKSWKVLISLLIKISNKKLNPASITQISSIHQMASYALIRKRCPAETFPGSGIANGTFLRICAKLGKNESPGTTVKITDDLPIRGIILNMITGAHESNAGTWNFSKPGFKAQKEKQLLAFWKEAATTTLFESHRCSLLMARPSLPLVAGFIF